MIRQLTMYSLAALVLTGCAQLPRLNELVSPSPLTIVTRMQALEDTKERNRLAQSTLDRYERSRSTENTLRLALVRSLPGHELSDDAEALVLLEALNEHNLTASQRRLRTWLQTHLKYRLALRDTNGELRKELRAANSALTRAQEKIDILTRIEQTMGPSSETNE